MGKDKGVWESVVLVVVAGILLVPYVILSAIPMSDGMKLVMIVTTAIPFMFVYLTIMFNLMDWSDGRRADRLQKEAE